MGWWGLAALGESVVLKFAAADLSHPSPVTGLVRAEKESSMWFAGGHDMSSSSPHGMGHVGRCAHCDKRVYVSRGDAKRAALSLSAAGRRRLRAYRCPHATGTWHLGHLPARVLHGYATREGTLQVPESAFSAVGEGVGDSHVA